MQFKHPYLALKVLALFAIATMATQAQQLSSIAPGHGTQVTTTRPTISATFTDEIESAQIWVDGTEFTGQAQLFQRGISWTPGYNLDFGVHRVRVQGRNYLGERLNGEWEFTIVNPHVAPSQPPPPSLPYGQQLSGRWFSTSGSTIDVTAQGQGGSVDVVAYAQNGSVYYGNGRWLDRTSFRYQLRGYPDSFTGTIMSDGRIKVISNDANARVTYWSRYR